VRIRVSIINHPPVALPHPSRDPDRAYDVVPGRTYTLDGSQSYDPDEDDLPQAGFDADRITSFAWDTNGDGTFETEGAQIEFQVPANWMPEENRSIQFRVCDDGQWVGVARREPARVAIARCAASARCVSPWCRTRPRWRRRPRTSVDVEEAGRELHVTPPTSVDPDGGALTYEWTCDDALGPGRSATTAPSTWVPASSTLPSRA
jgi:hypothetical protein